ncbi:MAG: ATP-dependent zinc metalloprotease FtsH [Desulfofustis sp. PB-SRB1]|jgi:cell division protease FtsH|nr:ATP-dependent zinc metalloprotease FtsH [Desulfofustis sp. PB-SRB1]MBM1002378.1 ATP-dependent zinc metalloprotease FtsH [Desulfofustis sp. PB-SRB1]HBH28919.1 ATP-dependent metallopeptidase FtsH/Yme1/Tma family protein [Desulfofustis sp.]HBH32295.1 ATP-dependent metallopeptidase FtsH/Yme1/Tma family protein [Desulfofustis sp.]
MEKQTKFNIWYVIAAIWGVLLLQNIIFDQFRPVVIPYSEFIEAVLNDKVIEIAVGQDRISGKMRADDGTEQLFTTVRVDTDLSQKLSEHNVKFSGQVENTFIKAILSWLIPIGLFFGIWYFMMRRMQAGQAGIMSFGKNKAKVVGEKDIETRFTDVAGADEAKEELQEVVDYLEHPQTYLEVGGQMPKGVILVGPPGTGKTLIARAVAGEAGVPFFSMSGSDFVEMFVGMGAARVRDLFVQAREKAPCIIFIDELDAIGKARGAGGITGGHDEREQTLNQLLVEMDGFDTQKGIVILAATNRPEVLDPALLRSGRFDRQVLIDKPDVNGREEILKIHARKVNLAEGVNLRTIAQKTAGFSGADLANAVNEAALLAVRKKLKQVTEIELDEAVDRIIGGLEKKNRVINSKEKKIVAYHEVGHALVAALTEGSEPVHKISIIPRGLAALGYTQQRPTEDRYLMSEQELLAKIDVLLGGRIAEQITFNSVTTGAGNDLMRATDIARAMVVEYGMGETLGLTTYPRQRNPVFLQTDMSSSMGRDYSDETASQIDQESKQILAQRQHHVTEMLTRCRDSLTAIAEKLLEKEVLYEKEFMAMVPVDQLPDSKRDLEK